MMSSLEKGKKCKMVSGNEPKGLLDLEKQKEVVRNLDLMVRYIVSMHLCSIGQIQVSFLRKGFWLKLHPHEKESRERT